MNHNGPKLIVQICLSLCSVEMESQVQCLNNSQSSQSVSDKTPCDDSIFHSLTFSNTEASDNHIVSADDLSAADPGNGKISAINISHNKLLYEISPNELSTLNVQDIKPESQETAWDFVEETPVLKSPSKSKGKGRSVKNALKNRYKTVIPKEYKGKSGTRSRDPANLKHKCQFCDKAFACGYSLTRHARIHTGEQCYQCDICDKIFTTRSSKIRHDRTHISTDVYN